MKFNTTDDRSITWNDGEISGDAELLVAVHTVVSEGGGVVFNFWGERPASLATEFDAYITIGSVLEAIYAVAPTVDEIPDNPDGYMPEGPIISQAITAAVKWIEEFYNPNQPRDKEGQWAKTAGRVSHDELMKWGEYEKDYQYIKHDGSIRVAKAMTNVERMNVRDGLDFMIGSSGSMWELEEFASDVGQPLGMTAGVAAQLTAVAHLEAMDDRGKSNYAMVEKVRKLIDGHNNAVDDGKVNVEESLAGLSDEIEKITGISIESGFVSYMNQEWAHSSMSPGSVMMHIVAANATQSAEAMDALKRADPNGGLIRHVMPDVEKMRKALHAVYEATYRVTQEEFERAGITEVTLYRGVQPSRIGNGGTVDTIIAQPNPLSSWSTSEEVAGRFGSSEKHVYQAVIPVENIFSLNSVTGFGAWEEREMVVLGNARITATSTKFEVKEQPTEHPGWDDYAVKEDEVVYIDADDYDWIKTRPSPVVAAATRWLEFYDPSQPRDREGQWTSHRGRITSLSAESIERSYGKGVRGLFGNSMTTTTVPWPSAPRLKGKKVYDEALVSAELRKPPVLGKVDPRILYATQPGLARTHIDYYMGDEYARSGKTSADQNNVANAFPIVYVKASGQHLILTGHHRAGAALAKGEDLDARFIYEEG